ncbi:hypothetical protein C3F00_045925, partial [Pseudomonas sp. MWU13-2860]
MSASGAAVSGLASACGALLSLLGCAWARMGSDAACGPYASIFLAARLGLAAAGFRVAGRNWPTAPFLSRSA